MAMFYWLSVLTVSRLITSGRQYALPTSAHGVATHKTNTDFTAFRTSNLKRLFATS
jgi:hypothetical protein